MSDPATEPVDQGKKVREGTVYVFFDKHDNVLYVGMTSLGPGGRFQGHVTKPWWKEVVRAEFHHRSTEYMTRRAEAAYIDLLKPIHNVVRPWGMCKVCGEKVHAYGRCGACAQYFKKHGRERSQEMIDRTRKRRAEAKIPPGAPTIRVVDGGSFANRHRKLHA